jgi:hypothetical protein
MHRNAGNLRAKSLLLSNFNENYSALRKFSKTPRYLFHDNLFNGPQVITCDKINSQINTMLIFIEETNTMHKLQTHLIVRSYL